MGDYQTIARHIEYGAYEARIERLKVIAEASVKNPKVREEYETLLVSIQYVTKMAYDFAMNALPNAGIHKPVDEAAINHLAEAFELRVYPFLNNYKYFFSIYLIQRAFKPFKRCLENFQARRDHMGPATTTKWGEFIAQSHAKLTEELSELLKLLVADWHPAAHPSDLGATTDVAKIGPSGMFLYAYGTQDQQDEYWKAKAEEVQRQSKRDFKRYLLEKELGSNVALVERPKLLEK
ncbi:hypothetical protein H072_8284 [Dactylellina haptotyla CBS 200.50]|uniref:Uncharacterized protein n=1 Tax=Dactylellina haptotyla (strain CBS 200.50) TaxID=1284197 RepID=S8AA91_DACHA|nr:hypothetical protein H072_8284 [Dactylellina haptotyla CBS 200.50]